MLTPDLFTALAANESVLVLWLGCDGRVRGVNRGFELVSGWSGEEATGRLWPDDFCVRGAELDPRFSGTTSLPPRDAPAGATRDIQWSGSVLPDGSGVLVVGGVVAHTAAAHGHLLKGLLDAFPGLVGLYTPAGDMIDACRDSLALSGRVRGGPNAKPADHPSLASDLPLRERVRDAFARAALGETVSFDANTPTVPPGKPLSSVAVTVRPVFSEGGVVTHIASFGADTTGLEATLAELGASEARLREAQRLSKVSSWLAHDGRFEFSDETNRIFELDPPLREAPYETMLAVVHPDDRERVDHVFRRAHADGQPYDHVARLCMADGRIKWVRARGETLVDPATGTARMFGTTQDVTDTLLVKHELRMHSAALLSLGDGVQFIDAERIIRFTNPALDAMFGYGPGELLGKSVSVLDDGTPEEQAARRARVDEGLTEHGAWDGELPTRRKDGSVFTARVSVRRVDGPSGPLFVSILHDDTEDRRATASLLENVRLETEARYGQDLLAELHHRVNNNLQLIASMLRVAFWEASDAALRATVASALHRVEAIALAHEHLSLAPGPDARDMAQHLKQLADAIVAMHGRSTSVLVDVEAPPLELPPEDFMNLGMIANELLVNAFRHGIGSRPTGRIQLSLSVGEGGAQLVVLDDGPGIQPPTSSTLGLQIVTQLAQRMGGEARWTDAPGGGTRATVSFPLRKGSPLRPG